MPIRSNAALLAVVFTACSTPNVNTVPAAPTTGALTVGAPTTAAAAAAPAVVPVTIASLLSDMIDRDSLARYPVQDFRLKQDSSYNRESVTPAGPQEKPTGWFANRDYNTKEADGNFIRTETINGRKEFVLMESEGPGAIVRSWMPWRGADKPETDLVIRFYLDGSEEPVLEGNMLTLLNGDGLIPYPFAHKSLRSAVSFFPIPYAKGCKVTVSGCPFFYIFTYREYAEGTPVKSCSLEDFEAAAGQIEAVGSALLAPRGPEVKMDAAAAETAAFNTTLEPGQTHSVDLPAGMAAVRALSVKLGQTGDPEVTRKLVLAMNFDGKNTVWCPLSEFFGGGIGLNPVEGWFRSVDGDGTMSSRWVMPYQRSGKVSLVNLNEQPVDVTLDAQVGAWSWDDSSMLFHASWRGQYPVPTRPFSDWNYVTIQGRGVYVGDTLTVMNPVKRWWGEGDAKIYVDGEDFPSLFGTGTEDYYAYSWGGRSTDFYEHPFHNQPFSHVYNKDNRKTKVRERNSMGYSTEGRDRALDTMPFAESLQLDMEVWTLNDVDMGYGVGVMWYGDASSRSNHQAAADEVRNVPPLPAEMASESATMGGPVPTPAVPNFAEDAAFMEQHTDLIVLQDGDAAVAVAPAYQGRVMTSTYDSESGPSFGWINRPVIEAGFLAEAERKGTLQEHIYIFGGEERFWLGPEGGQYAIFFGPGEKFDFRDWNTPAAIDTDAYAVVNRTPTSVTFEHDATLTNFTGTRFEVGIRRTVKLVDDAAVAKTLGAKVPEGVRFVGYATDNQITNTGNEAWKPETGLLSIWLLGMYNPSPQTTVVIPLQQGPEDELGKKVTDDYFGKVPPEHLIVEDDVLFMRGDGTRRGKIGVNDRRSTGVAGSYDAVGQVLTLVTYGVQDAPNGFVNSTWELQDQPYGGDVINAYNDGSPEPGSPPLGPFYELETSSPAAALAPGKSMRHVQQTLHLKGDPALLTPISQRLLGVGINEITMKF